MEQLLENKDTTIYQVLLDQGLSSAIRSGTKNFVDLVKNNLEIILDICLTKKYWNDANFKKYLKSAISILTSQSKDLMSRIMMNEHYIERMRRFLQEDGVKDPLISGNFLCVFEGMTRFTQGNFIDDFKDFPLWAVENCYTYAMRELLSNLMIDYPKKFLKKEIALKIAKCSGEAVGLYAMGAALIMLASRHEDGIEIFKEEIIVEELLKTTIKKDIKPETLIVTFALLYKIISSNYALTDDQMNKYSQLFFEMNKNIRVDVLSEALKVLNCNNFDILVRILDNSTPSILRNSILMQFKRMKDDHLKEMIENNAFAEKIISAFPKRGYNTSILFLIEHLQKFEITNDGWEETKKAALDQIKRLNEPYGGDKPVADGLIIDEVICKEDKVKEKEGNTPMKPAQKLKLTLKSLSQLIRKPSKPIVSKVSDDSEEDDNSGEELKEGLPDDFGVDLFKTVIKK